MLEADGGADLVQQLLGALLLRALPPNLDRARSRMHNTGVVGPEPQFSAITRSPGVLDRIDASQHRAVLYRVCSAQELRQTGRATSTH